VLVLSERQLQFVFAYCPNIWFARCCLDTPVLLLLCFVVQVISLKDSRLKGNQEKAVKEAQKAEEEKAPKHVDQTPSALWYVRKNR
jgi:hypothetical protein